MAVNLNSTNLVGTEKILDLGIINNYKTRGQDGFGNTTSAFSYVDGKNVGFAENDYPAIRELASRISEITPFNKLADTDFLERQIVE